MYEGKARPENQRYSSGREFKIREYKILVICAKPSHDLIGSLFLYKNIIKMKVKQAEVVLIR